MARPVSPLRVPSPRVHAPTDFYREEFIRHRQCLAQQREVMKAHELAEFHSVSLDVDLNERPPDLADYAEREGFDWQFAMADVELANMLRDRFGTAVLIPPSTPKILLFPDGSIRALEFGRHRSAQELVDELSAD
jgi:hypothetical protein